MKKLAIVFCLLLLAPSAIASPFYRETFKLCSTLETSSKDAMDLTGWKAFKSDSSIGKVGFLKINSPGSANNLIAYNSLPVGPEHGGAFWSKSVAGLTIFTDEFSFDVGNLVLVQYEQRLSGYDRVKKAADGTKIALLIGNTWYISDQMVRQINPGNFEPVAFAVRELTYGTSPNRNGRGPEQPGNFGVKLPTQGIVSAFGVFLPNVTGRVRLDNYTLSDSVIDLRTPGEQGSLAQCAYIPPPAIPGTPPVGATPGGGGTATPSSEVQGVFCQGQAARALGKIKATAAVRRQLLASVSGNTLKAARDRALLSILLNNNLRIDNLVNTSVQDYYSVGTLQVLNASGVTKQTTPIKPAVKYIVDQYIALAGLNNRGKLPLFQSLSKKETLTNVALCTDNIRRIVLRRAKQAKVDSQVKILS